MLILKNVEACLNVRGALNAMFFRSIPFFISLIFVVLFLSKSVYSDEKILILLSFLPLIVFFILNDFLSELMWMLHLLKRRSKPILTIDDNFVIYASFLTIRREDVISVKITSIPGLARSTQTVIVVECRRGAVRTIAGGNLMLHEFYNFSKLFSAKKLQLRITEIEVISIWLLDCSIEDILLSE